LAQFAQTVKKIFVSPYSPLADTCLRIMDIRLHRNSPLNLPAPASKVAFAELA